MADELRSYPVPNLVQGVSQQAPQNRRETQCEEQFDCINSPILGCDARPPLEFQSLLVDAQYTNSFFYEIKRGTSEHYLVVITHDDSVGGVVEVFDLNTGDACEVLVDVGANAYLATVAQPKDVFVASTVEDFTFICNRELIPEMDDTDLSPAKVNQAIVFWRASGYMINFQLSITYGGNVYTWTYKTPDNSTAGNAEYITTNAVAATFYRTLTGLSAPVRDPNGEASTGTNENVGGTYAGSTSGVTGNVTATSLGFTVRLNGNCILIGRADTNAFTVDTADGVGDTYMRAVKDNVQAFSDLPKNCFKGFTTKVRGSNKETADDYYVRFQDADGSGGYWAEVVAPNVPLTPLGSSMPHVLINTSPGHFSFQEAPWGARVSGDGVESAEDPSFIGKQIWDVFYDNNRLAIMTEGACCWSKANQPFVFFPSSAQTILATDPVDVQIGGGKQIVLLRKSVQTDEQTFLWAQKRQFRVSSGQEAFKQDTVEAKPSTSFEFAETPDPLPVADSLYFVTEPGRHATVRDLTIQDGKPRGSTDVTAHVKKYIPAGVRRLAASDTLGVMAISTDGAPTNLYIYNFLIGDNEQGLSSRLQSAWNTWRLPVGGQLLWHSIAANEMRLAIQRPEGVLLCRVDLSPEKTDEGYYNYTDYMTRLDYRMTQDNTSIVYDADLNISTIFLPFNLFEAQGDENRDPSERRCMVVQHVSSSVALRGRVWPIVNMGGTEIQVQGNCTGQALFIGLRIKAERLESEFFIRTQQGMVPAERLQVHDFTVFHSDTGYYRVEVDYKGGKQGAYHMTGRVFGDIANVTGSFPIVDGQLKVPINSSSGGATIRLVNDSFLPSRWQTTEYQYTGTFRAQPTRR